MAINGSKRHRIDAGRATNADDPQPATRAGHRHAARILAPES